MSRTINWFLAAALTVASVGLAACSDSASTNAEELNGNSSYSNSGAEVQVVDVVATELCPDVDVASATTNASRTEVDNWTFFTFAATAGNQVVITVDPSDGNDPFMWVMSGTSTTTSGYSYNFNRVPTDMTLLARLDNGGCGENETYTFTAASTGTYTVAVFRTSTCSETDNAFTINVSGADEGEDCAPADSDGDGVPDDEDTYPSSITIESVAIGYGTPNECEPGIDNILLDNGAYMMDLIQDCINNNNTKTARKVCLKNLADDWVAQGLISQNQKAGILSCAY